VRRAFALLTTLIMLLAVGSLPGTRLRPYTGDDAANAAEPEHDTRRSSLRVAVRANAAKGGASVNQAEVRVFERDGQRIMQVDAVKTNAQGGAFFSELRHGIYCIIADAADYARAATWIVLLEDTRDVALELGEEAQIDIDVRSEAGVPLVAEVEVVTDSPVPTGAKTDANGHAHIRGLPGKRFAIKARAPGYDEVIRRGILAGDHVQLVLPQLATLVAVVVHKGTPAPGAYVHLASTEMWPPRLAAATSDGTVKVHGLKPGLYALRATKGNLVAPTEVGIALERGKETAVRLELQDGATLNVRVVEAGDPLAPVAGAKIVGVERGLSSFPIEAVSDKKGIVQLGPFAIGDVSVLASHPEFVPKGPIPLTPPFAPNVQIALDKAGTVEGRVVDARGFPIYGAHLRIVGYDFAGLPFEEDPSLLGFRSRPVLEQSQRLLPIGELGVMPGPLPPIPGVSGASGASGARTEADMSPARDLLGPKKRETAAPWVSKTDGTFTLTPASPGRLRVLVKHPEFVDQLSEAFSLAPGGSAQVQITLKKGGVIEGSVVDAKGRPAEGVDVVLASNDGERSIRSGSDGSFAFAAILGDVVLSVRSQEDPLSVLSRTTVTVPDSGSVKVQLTIPSQRDSVQLRVDDDRGYPLDFVQVSATSLDVKEPVRVTAFTDKRGEAKLNSIAGLKVRLELRAPGHAPKVMVMNKAEGTLRVALDVGERLEGEVRGARGEAPPSAEVTLDLESGLRRVFATDQGAFAFDGLEAGSATLKIRAPGFAPTTQKITIEKERGRRSTRIARLTLETESAVEGTIVDERGSPVPGARVATSPASAYTLANRAGEATTDARGAFRLGELPKGNTTLHVYAAEYARVATEPFMLGAGESKRVDRIVLRRTAADQTTTPESGPTLALTLGEASESGHVVIVAVIANGGAERGGLRAGDIVLSVQGARVKSIVEARRLMTGPLSDDVLVDVQRGERELSVRAPRDSARK
jgi:hypothetical protein